VGQKEKEQLEKAVKKKTEKLAKQQKQRKKPASQE
jgi:hypothetical protein